MKRGSFATFRDGHEEEIFYYKDCAPGNILFATESGVYFYKKGPEVPGIVGTFPKEFFTIEMAFEDGNVLGFPRIYFSDNPYLTSVTIDRRVERRFNVPGYGTGSVLVDPNATVEEIAVAIVTEMGVVISDEE